MSKEHEARFTEVAVDKLLMESFANEASAYYQDIGQKERSKGFDQLRSKLKWHVSRSLSPRQRQVITLYLQGKKQREIAAMLGITQQVVSIYKQRAIKKLQKIISG